MKRLAMTALVMTTAGTAMAFDEYRNDDGVPEQNIGITGGGNADRQIAWLNRFVIQPGEENITGMRVAFGNIPNGEFVTGFLWYDANQDGNPDDAFFVTFRSELVVNATPVNPAGWTYFDFPDTLFIPGDIIYAGCVMDISPNEAPARIDFDGNDQPVITYPPNHHSYIAGDTINPIAPNDMDMAQLPITRVANAGWVLTAPGSSDSTQAQSIRRAVRTSTAMDSLMQTILRGF